MSFSKVAFSEIPTANVEAIINSPEEKALVSQYETLAPRYSADEPELLVQLNESLKSKTFVAGNVFTKADLLVFANVLPLTKSLSKSNDDLAKFRHILRWADLIQSNFVDVPEDAKLVLDYDVKLPREVKEKKKPAAAPAAPAAAASGAEKKNVEGKKAAAPAQAGGAAPTEEQKKANAEAAKAKKAAKAKAKAEAAAKQAAAVVPPNPSMIDFRVGFIQKAVKHPDADSLYMSTIDMGDAEGPRTVCSGLVKYVPLEDMQERYVITIANLKPVSMRGVKSTAMVLCASNADTVEFVNPPPGSKAGDKIFFETFDGVPEKQLNPKKKVWEALQPLFSTNENFEVTFTEEGKEPKRLVNAKGELCKNSTLVKADVK
ncbi:tRNA-aminoacylation cofactor Arc1p [[Candida] railenensis]|uniref:tRNA-aminoacylation cofactor Arc1p n=1 Tax=[Candida] railenensis TaxID=45579 RepID=A0A9P0QKW0_9ASCO|nr:tRNA-aminoacylation cofactor Arc1p [[Candida] railenensis]